MYLKAYPRIHGLFCVWVLLIFELEVSELNELIASYLDFKLHNDGCSARTVEVYGLALQRLMLYFDKRDPLKATHDDLILFTGIWLHKKGLKDPVSRRTHISAVRGFYSWAHENKHIPNNAAAGVPYPRSGRKIPRVMSLANAEKLMWAPDFGTFEGVRDGAMLAVLMGCGLRANGLVSLNESDVIEDELDGQVRMLLKVREKGDKERKLPVPVEADLMLRLYLEHPDLKEIDRTLPNGDRVLFVSVRNRTIPEHEYIGENRRLNRRAVNNMMARYGQALGIPDAQLHPHALRHLYGTELTEDDVSLLNTQLLMGHEDGKSTKIYTHTAMRKLIREVDRANPMAKMRTPVTDLLKQLKGKP
jgi:integrase/recombinase XerD